MGHYNTELWYHEPLNFTNFDPAALVMSLAALLLSLSLHESAHAWVADYLGDYTARRLAARGESRVETRARDLRLLARHEEESMPGHRR